MTGRCNEFKHAPERKSKNDFSCLSIYDKGRGGAFEGRRQALIFFDALPPFLLTQERATAILGIRALRAFLVLVADILIKRILGLGALD